MLASPTLSSPSQGAVLGDTASAKLFACWKPCTAAPAPCAHSRPQAIQHTQRLCAALQGHSRPRRPCTTCYAKSGAALEPLTAPHAAADVDSELWAVLDLCSNDELEEVHGILFGATQSVFIKGILNAAVMSGTRWQPTGADMLYSCCRKAKLWCVALRCASSLATCWQSFEILQHPVRHRQQSAEPRCQVAGGRQRACGCGPTGARGAHASLRDKISLPRGDLLTLCLSVPARPCLRPNMTASQCVATPSPFWFSVSKHHFSNVSSISTQVSGRPGRAG